MSRAQTPPTRGEVLVDRKLLCLSEVDSETELEYGLKKNTTYMYMYMYM